MSGKDDSFHKLTLILNSSLYLQQLYPSKVAEVAASQKCNCMRYSC